MRYGLDPWSGFLKRGLQENRAINQKHPPSLYFLNAGLSKINISVTFFSIVGNTGDCCKNAPPCEEGRAKYGKRKWMVEPVFGDMKQNRNYRGLLLRGELKALGEFLRRL